VQVRCILLVEDNADDEALTLRALRRCPVPLAVDVARDGAEAIARALARATAPYEMMLLDLKLPKLSGLDVLRRVRAEPSTSLLPVVILTSSVEESDVRACYAAGANSYVRKPITFEEFARAVEIVGRFWLDLNVSPARAARSR
jgi:two-component system response regulator